jgi:2-isopropylmalate synthase
MFTPDDNLECLTDKLQRFGLQAGAETLAALQRKLDLLESQGWQLDAADASFCLLVLKFLKRYRPWFELDRYSVLARGSFTVRNDAVLVEASVKVVVDGEIRHTVRDGTGPIHALELALREALRPTYPRLDEMVLTNYAVQVIDGEQGTAANLRVAVQCWDRAHGLGWGSVAVSDDVVRASCQAIVDCMDYKRWVDAEETPFSPKHSSRLVLCHRSAEGLESRL